MHPRRPLVLLLALAGWLSNPAASSAADDSAEFFDALRSRGFYELAIDYAESLKQASDTPDATRKRLDYERAVTLLEQAQSLTSRAAREAAVQSARSDLEAFISRGDPTLAAEASAKLADALASAAKRQVAAAERLESGKNQEIADARDQFDQAREYYQKSEQLLDKALEPLASVQPGSEQARERLNLRFQLAQARLKDTLALEAIALTYGERSKERKDQLTEAAKLFAALYEKYDTAQSAGVAFYAHLYEGRCYQEMDNHRLAEGCFETMIALPDQEPSFRRLITLGHTYRTISLVANKEYDKALTEGDRWLRRVERGEQSLPDTLALKYQLGEAARLAAEATEDKDDRRKLEKQARDYFADASRGFNEHQADARVKLVELSQDGEQLAAATFDEAYQIGVNALLASTLNNDDAQGGKLEALDAFRQALRLANVDTPVARVNDARAKLSYLLYEQQDYLRSAVLAEFVATQYPSDPAAEQAAKLALASLDQLYQQANQQGGDASFATDELVRLSEFLTRRWAGQPLADTAFGVLLAAAIRDDRLDDARRVLADVSPDSRAPLELKLSIAAWEQAARAGDPTAKQAAAGDLERAVDAMRGKTVTDSLATAALLLAQAKLQQGDARAALALLNDKQFGPLKLVGARSPVVQREGFAAQTYRTALQSYLTVVPPRTDDAMKVMKSLEQAAGDPSAVTRTYFALGVQLQKQIESLTESGRRADAERVSDAFAEFIGSIGQSADIKDWTMQQWLAQTYLRLGEGLTGAKQKKFFENARDGFQRLLDAADKDPSAAPSPNSVLAVRMQLGNALVNLGEYAPAIDLFAGLLEEREMMLDVQKSAAYAFQAWGKAEDPAYFDKAVRGDRTSLKTGKNVIWGWSKLASVAGRAARTQPKFRDLFFESWLNVATCRYEGGMKATGQLQEKQLASARKTILLLSRQYPDLGGAERRAEFDALLKKIQKAAGEKADGLSEFAQ